MPGTPRAFKNHSPRFIKPVISDNDEGVPQDTHIPIMEFIQQMNDKDAVIGMERAKELRRKSFYNVLDLFVKYGSKDYPAFWNIHIEEIAQLKLNEFANIPQLKPFCNYIECFATKHTSQTNNKYWLISFGLSKRILKEYFEAYDKSQKNGTEFVPPKIKFAGKKKNRDFVIFGDYEVCFPNKTKVHIEQNEIFRRFSDWCMIQGITKREGIIIAIQDIVSNNPISGVNPLEEYHIETELDKIYKINHTDRYTAADSLHIMIEPPVRNKMEEIILNYNSDPKNKVKELTSTAYINNAIADYNRRVSIKYSAPEQYEQIKKIKAGE